MIFLCWFCISIVFNQFHSNILVFFLLNQFMFCRLGKQYADWVTIICRLPDDWGGVFLIPTLSSAAPENAAENALEFIAHSLQTLQSDMR